MNTNAHSEDLKAIRKIMEESSRFLSLNGLSGIFAGLIAICGSIIAAIAINKSQTAATDNLELILLADALIVLFAALGISVGLSIRKASRRGLKIWTTTTRRMLLNLLVPLVTGAVLILAFYLDGNYEYLIPSMLVFYGLALVSAGKFTFGEIQYLGIFEILAGVLALFFPGQGLVFWAFGFGILHILYGLIMHIKYR
ncbi:MAG: hypothetical protein RQ743_02375 [Bacteroidales bacterium]|nr:hypothetical protein [Bacteroidales bacterium]